MGINRSLGIIMNPKYIIKAHNVDSKKLSLSDPKTNENGGKCIYLNYNNNPIIIQTPKVTLPYNMSIYDKGEYPKYSVEISFRDMETNPKIQGFYENMEKLDKLIVNTAVDNSMTWLKKKKVHQDVVSALFTTNIKLSKDKETGELDGKYPPTMKLKLPVRDGKPGFDIYDFSKQKLDKPLEELFVKGSTLAALIKCSGIWIISGKIYCSWTVCQTMIDAPTTIESYSFIDDSDDENENDDDDDELIESSDDDE